MDVGVGISLCVRLEPFEMLGLVGTLLQFDLRNRGEGLG